MSISMHHDLGQKGSDVDGVDEVIDALPRSNNDVGESSAHSQGMYVHGDIVTGSKH